jgi:hypothetical protein
VAWGRPGRLAKLVAGLGALLAVSLPCVRSARADIVAVHMGAYGGLSSHPSGAPAVDGSSVTPGLGFELGLRLLIFEAYVDRMAFGDGRGTTRGIIGIRAGYGIGGVRLWARAGFGAIFDQGGTLSGVDPGIAVPDRHGVVARAGVGFEKPLNPNVFTIGFGVDGEYFTLDSPTVGTVAVRSQGSDILASVRFKFEVGI